MRYFDTSFLVPLVLPEATSEAIAAFLEGLPGDELATSHWTRVEFASLLAREVRVGGLDVSAARQAASRFEDMVNASFVILLPDRDDFDRARDLLVRFTTGLRAADALHLTIAENRRAAAIHTLDKSMIAAGKRLGMPTGAGTPLEGYDD